MGKILLLTSIGTTLLGVMPITYILMNMVEHSGNQSAVSVLCLVSVLLECIVSVEINSCTVIKGAFHALEMTPDLFCQIVASLSTSLSYLKITIQVLLQMQTLVLQHFPKQTSHFLGPL